MSRERRLASLLIVLHLSALVIGAIPAPAKLPNQNRQRDAGRNVLSRTLTPVLDTLAVLELDAHGFLWRSVRPGISTASTYLSAFGLAQSWAMFSVPPRFDSYVRLRYYVGDEGRVNWIGSELVGPAYPEDRIKLLASYPASYQDKALEVAFSEFREHRERSALRPDTTAAELPVDLEPVVRYFSRRFAATHLTSDERIVRVEIWAGEALNPPPGAANVGGTPVDRLEILQAYRDGLNEDRAPGNVLPPYHAVQQEGDINWTLEFAVVDVAR